MKIKHYSVLAAPVMRGRGRTRCKTIRRSWFAAGFGAWLFTGLFALSPSSVQAQCQLWDLSGKWRLAQGPTKVEMDLTQNGVTITGKANHRPSGGLNVRGTVNGYTKREHFYVEIKWSNHTTGIYKGTIEPSGRILGTGHNAKTPSQKVSWYSVDLMQCAESTGQVGKMLPTPTPPGMDRPGAKPTPRQMSESESQAAQKAAEEQAAKAPPPVLSAPGGEAGKSTRPYIRALPQIVSIPEGESEALTKLVWYAGNDHPDAQLVVEVDGGDENIVQPQRKGSRQVKVKAGKKYKYSLIDAGKPLASVIVQTDQAAPPDRSRMRGEQPEAPQDAESANDAKQEEE
jgi:hypothetical protein